MIQAIALALCLTAADGDRWPGFLGDGASQVDPASIPLEWSTEKNLAWTATVKGYGQSSPVIWGKQVIVTSVEGAMKENLHVTSFDLATGEQVWERVTKSNYLEKNSVYVSRAAPTPLVDETHVFAYFESGDVLALTHAGKPVWKKSLTAKYGAPQNRFGVSGSPVQVDDRIIVLVDDPGAAYLVALDKKSGDVLWKKDRTSRTSWSSPGVIRVDGQAQVVCSSAGSVDGYDPKTGEQLWSFADVGGNTATSPIDLGGGRFLVAASPGRQGDNAALAKKSNGLMVVRRDGEKWKADFAWQNEQATPSWASPVAYQGNAYWINRVGAVFCLDMKSGKEIYTKRLKQSCWATPVGLGDHLYIFGKDGTTTVVRAGDKFEVVAENSLWSAEKPPVNNVPTAKETTEQRRQASAMFSRPILYGAAIVNGRIVVRSGSQVFCIAKENE